jgi:ferredoxin
MHIEVAAERCIGAGNCAEVASKYFTQGENDGLVRVLADSVDPAETDAVQRAADICPVGAILLNQTAPTP